MPIFSNMRISKYPTDIASHVRQCSVEWCKYIGAASTNLVQRFFLIIFYMLLVHSYLILDLKAAESLAFDCWFPATAPMEQCADLYRPLDLFIINWCLRSFGLQYAIGIVLGPPTVNLGGQDKSTAVLLRSHSKTRTNLSWESSKYYKARYWVVYPLCETCVWCPWERLE